MLWDACNVRHKPWVSLNPATPLSWDCSFRPVVLRPCLSARFALYGGYKLRLHRVYVKLFLTKGVITMTSG